MMKTLRVQLFVIVLFSLAGAQQVQVSQSNKTIAVTADESVSADPDIATITIGYQNYAETNKEAYSENVRVGKSVVEHLIASGMPRTQIESGEIHVSRTEPDQKWDAATRKERQFEAIQTWKIRVRAADAGKTVDNAMRAGANSVESVDWDVSDRSALQAKAGAAALAKARKIASQMASGLGAKLGDLVYASNQAPAVGLAALLGGQALQTVSAMVGSRAEPVLDLYPAKVKQEATVHAVFAIQ